jgi:hypothetical protein
MLDHTIPSEFRLSLYLSTRLLQELSLALRLIGVPSAYIRPGAEGVVFPRLYVGCADGELDDFVCAVPLSSRAHCPCRSARDPEWWFMWWRDQTMPICEATDMKQAARVIADQLLGSRRETLSVNLMRRV